MADNRNLIAIARRSRLIELPDGRTAELLELTLADWAAIQDEAAQAAKRDLIATYAKNVDLLPKEMREATLLDAFKRAEAITPDTVSTDRVVQWLSKSIHGKLYSVWRSLRTSWPGGLSYDEAAIIWQHKGVIDEERLEEAADIVADISGVTLGNESPPPEKAKPAGAQVAA